MKCPKCGKEGCKYLGEKKRGRMFEGGHITKRETYEAVCNKCGWKGVY